MQMYSVFMWFVFVTIIMLHKCALINIWFSGHSFYVVLCTITI